jgi:hypothetical protein
MTMLLYPSCVLDLARYSYVWSGLICPITANNRESLLAKRVVSGLAAIEAGYERIFGLIPDCIMVCKPLRIKHNKDGSVSVYAPFTALSTIPKVTNKDSDQVTREFHNVTIEVDCCACVMFSPKNVVTAASEHFFNLRISHHAVAPQDIVRYIGYA